MQYARSFPLLVIACALVRGVNSQSSSAEIHASAPASTIDLTRERTWVAESDAARLASDYATARAKAAQAVTSLLERAEAEHDAGWLTLLEIAAESAYEAQDARTAKGACQRVLEIRASLLPDDHPDLQMARQRLGKSMYVLGELAGARDLFAKVLEIRTRTLPEDHPELQIARSGLSAVMEDLGDHAGALALKRKVLDVLSRTLPEDHPDLQTARSNLATTLQALGDLAGAREMQMKVLEVRTRILPADHPDLQVARINLANTIAELGDLDGASALEELVLDVYARTLRDDHPTFQTVRHNHAQTLRDLGNLTGARAMDEAVLAACSRTLPEDNPFLQRVRQSLASSMKDLGDLAGARALYEKVLEVRSRTLADDNPDLQSARTDVARTMGALGDLAGARALQEKVLAVYTRTLPDDHPRLQLARNNLAETLFELDDLAGARELQEHVLEARLRTLPDQNPIVQMARANLASTISYLGEFDKARELQEQVLEVYSRTLPDGHPQLQRARRNLAGTIALQAARAPRTSAGDKESVPSRERERERCAELIGAMCRGGIRAAREAIVASPSREAEERCYRLAADLALCLSFASGYGVFEPLHALEADAFVFEETTRGAALFAAELTRKAAKSPTYEALRGRLTEASDELAALAQKGATSEAFDRARTKRESIERELVALALELSGDRERGLEFDIGSVAATLGEHDAVVGFRKFVKKRVAVVEEPGATGELTLEVSSTEILCAFVVRSTNAGTHDGAPSPVLTRVDLGPIEPISDVVHAWRDSLGAGGKNRGVTVSAGEKSTREDRKQGALLREKIFDPLVAALAGAQRVIVVLDDVLHLVPLDALPFDESSLVGDRLRIETRATLMEVLQAREPSSDTGRLVAFGDVEYGEAQAHDDPGTANELAAAVVEPRVTEVAGILRGGAWAEGFSALPGTGIEVSGIVLSYGDRFGADAKSEVCERAGATRERLLTLAPQAGWLHIATHGWFAPESIQSWSDPEPIDKLSGLGSRMSGAEQVKGMSPMLLCGLALAGANLSENATGRAPGLVTADELSTLDLSSCELVVLSACDTNVGERRAGQGVASLQKALQMAGARSVITSLWKVPDEATKDLMLDFYRRLWVEKKPKHQALWEAKTKLREAKDENGAPKYTTRDWAAWVLTGDPN